MVSLTSVLAGRYKNSDSFCAAYILGNLFIFNKIDTEKGTFYFSLFHPDRTVVWRKNAIVSVTLMCGGEKLNVPFSGSSGYGTIAPVVDVWVQAG